MAVPYRCGKARVGQRRSSSSAPPARRAEVLPPADADPDGEWRAPLLERMATIHGFVPLLCQVIEFDVTADAAPVLYELNGLPELLDARQGRKVAAGLRDARRIEVAVVPAAVHQSVTGGRVADSARHLSGL